MKSKVAVLVEPQRFEIQEMDIIPNEHQVLVKVASCGLCNWELNHWLGYLGEYPQRIGHEWNGVVIQTGNAVQSFKPGDRVAYCPVGQKRPGFAEYAVAEENMLSLVPEHIQLELAIGEPLKCVTTVARATRAEAGDIGIVLGCGPMGLWVVSILAGNMLSKLIAVDVDDGKLALATKYGATHAINPNRQDVLAEVATITNGYMADFVVEGSGVPQLLETAMMLSKDGRGRIIMMSSHKEKAKEFDFRIAVTKALEFIVAHPKYSQNTRDDMRRAMDMLGRGIFHVDELVTHRYSLDDINHAFRDLERKPLGFIKGIVLP